jgi:hypothetical protein
MPLATQAAGAVIDASGQLYAKIGNGTKVTKLTPGGVQIWQVALFGDENLTPLTMPTLSPDGTLWYIYVLDNNDSQYKLMARKTLDGSYVRTILSSGVNGNVSIITVNKLSGHIYTLGSASFGNSIVVYNQDGTVAWTQSGDINIVWLANPSVSPDGSIVYYSFISADLSTAGVQSFSDIGGAPLNTTPDPIPGPLGGSITGPTTAVDGTVYIHGTKVGGTGAWIWAYNPDLTLRWTYDGSVSNELFMQMVTQLDGGIVVDRYNPTHDILYLNGASGAVVWSAVASSGMIWDGEFSGGMAVDMSGEVFVSEFVPFHGFPSAPETFVDLNYNTGARDYEISGLCTLGEISVGNGHCYFINAADQMLYALD